MGFVDLHLHLLPAIDDGAKSLDDSVAMARALTAVGFTQAAPSPHHRDDYPSRSRARCAEALAQLQSAFKERSISLELASGAENYFLDDAFLADVSTPGQARTIAHGKFMLVEAPYTGPLPTLLDLIFRMKIKGLTPVIAHPERCFEFERKGRAADAVAQGALLQLDIGAMIGRYGKVAQKLAQQFLSEGLYAIAATDLHGPTQAEKWLTESVEALRRAVGDSGVRALLATNPAKILSGVSP